MNTQDNVITLYDRFRDGVRVTATQEPLSQEAIEALEAKAAAEAGVVGEDGVVAKKGNICRSAYIVRGFVNGEQVKEAPVEGGYRMTSPAARGMFKELHAAFGTPKAPKAPKETKVSVTDPVELQKMADKAKAVADRAVAKALKLAELAGLAAVTEVEVAEDAFVETVESDTEACDKAFEAHQPQE